MQDSVTLIPRWNAVPGSLNGKEANEEEIILKFDLNFSCSSPEGSKLMIICPITFRVNCNIQNFMYLVRNKMYNQIRKFLI